MKVTIIDVVSKLRGWAINGNVPHVRVTELLHLLRPFHPELPFSSKTLLHTPSIMTSKKLNNGECYHFGLLINLERILTEHDYSSCYKEIQLQINIDGLPLFRSSNIQLWPILCLLKHVTNSPFPIGIFCGTSKPDPLDIYLKDFINELEFLIQGGIEINGKKYKVVLHNFVCDAPARAYLKCVKSHTGYSACDKCTEYGEYVNGRIIFPNITATNCKRTNTSFRLQTDENYHLGTSPLTKLPIDFIKCFPIDYSHNVCLGIMRKLLNTWISGQPLSVKLSGHFFKQISKHLQQLRIYIPFEIHRKLRGLEDLPRWKGTEFRTFLLYVGPIVLKDNIDIAAYEHFLLFHVGISILVSDKHISEFSLKYVKKILTFIQHSENIYGRQFLIYNVHLLSHLTDDVDIFGPLDEFSTFPFENYLGKLKTYVKSPTNPLQQIFRRLTENYVLPLNKMKSNSLIKLMYSHNLGPLHSSILHTHCKQYKKVTFHDIVFSIDSSVDCYCMITENILI